MGTANAPAPNPGAIPRSSQKAVDLDPQRFSVTQLVSFTFFVITFVEICLRYDPKATGFGSLLSSATFAKLPKEGGFDRFLGWFILYSIVIANTLRYYLSFWLVELDEEFPKLRAAFSKSTSVFEWSLRAMGLICLYLIQLSLSEPVHKYLELILVSFYAVLVIWDWLIYALIPNNMYPTFKGKIVFWLRTEIFGLVACILYCVACSWFAEMVTWLAFSVGALATIFLGMFASEIFKNRKDYFNNNLHFWCVLLSLTIICALMSLAIHIDGPLKANHDVICPTTTNLATPK